MENSSLAFFPNSADSFSMRREANPDPVPPPNEWNTGSCNVKMNELLTHLPYTEKSLQTLAELQYLPQFAHGHLKRNI